MSTLTSTGITEVTQPIKEIFEFIVGPIGVPVEFAS
jgi:hypothetical protein